MKRSRPLAVVLALAFTVPASGQEIRTPFKVTIKDGGAAVGEPTLPIDPTQRITPQYSGQNSFGLTVGGKLITCSPQGSIWGSLKVDGRISDPFNDFQELGRVVNPRPLPNTPAGKKRLGTQSHWAFEKIDVTQIIEVVPSKPAKNAAPGQKRLLDTCRVTYILENKDRVAHKVAFKTSIDILIVNNDGALYASPTTHPGKILNGVALAGKELPECLWVLQNANLANPGFVATMTLKHAKGENPIKISLSNLGIVAGNFQDWDPAPAPAGDSACAIFWAEKELQPGEKRQLVWGYGGGVSTSPESEGRVSLGLAGSFEPNKLFAITAHVDDPLPEQALALELPAGLERVEGRPIQSVALAPESGTSVVLWKARVLRPGDYGIRVRSSNGSVQSKRLLIEKAP
jgi:hypothetical protein